MAPLGRPVRSDGVVIEALDQGIYRPFNVQYAVGDERHGGVGPRDAAHLVVEPVQVQPVSGLGDGDQVDAGVGKPAVFGKRRSVGHPFMGLGLFHLGGAGVRRDDPVEALGQQHRQLAGTASAIERQPVARAGGSQFFDQCDRVGGPVSRIVRGAGGEVVFERRGCHVSTSACRA
ncbi:hypothetical protein D9M71_487500 [compost metagenome]